MMVDRKTWAGLAAAAMLALGGMAAAGLSPAVAQARLPYGPFTVFLKTVSADSAAHGRDIRETIQSKNILENAATLIKENGGDEPILVMGSVDDILSDAQASAASLAMAQAVGEFLVAQGVPASRIRLEAAGASRPLYVTNKGVAEPKNRYVEIRVGKGTGW